MELDPNDLITSSKVARIGDVSVPTVFQMERRGVLVPVMRLPNGTRLYSQTEAQRVFAERAARNATQPVPPGNEAV